MIGVVCVGTPSSSNGLEPRPPGNRASSTTVISGRRDGLTDLDRQEMNCADRSNFRPLLRRDGPTRTSSQWIENDGHLARRNLSRIEASQHALRGLPTDFFGRLHLVAMPGRRHPVIALHSFFRLRNRSAEQAGTCAFVGAGRNPACSPAPTRDRAYSKEAPSELTIALSVEKRGLFGTNRQARCVARASVSPTTDRADPDPEIRSGIRIPQEALRYRLRK